MTDILKIKKLNEVYMELSGPEHLLKQLSDTFCFYAPNYKYDPKFKYGYWDGKIRLINYKHIVYFGLLEEILNLQNKLDFEVELNFDNSQTEFSVLEAEEFCKTLNLPWVPRDYQIKAFVNAIRRKRALIISPTSSGKTLIAFMIISYYMAKNIDFKFLMIVPTIGLLLQLKNDFIKYGMTENLIYSIKGGVDKEIPKGKNVILSTWRSMKDQDEKYLSQFNCIIIDECHEAKSASLTSILKKLYNCQHRFGLTGSLDGSKTNEMILEGLFNKPYKVITTKELIDRKEVAALKIKVIVLDYIQEIREDNKKRSFLEEIEFITGFQKRNNFITNLALSLKNNTLILTNRVESHGQILYDLIKEKNEKTYFIYAATEAEERERIKDLLESNDGVIIIGSHRCIGTGTDYKKLHNIIYAYPTKSVIQVLQSIGRGLRLGKEFCTLYDIADDMKIDNHINFGMRHLKERLKHYKKEKFEYKSYNVKLGD